MPELYIELTPLELAAAWRDSPVAVVPWGALEWHGPHLPLGLDGLLAESFAELLAESVDGVLLPTMWLPMTALPHEASIDFPTAAVVEVWRRLFAQLHRAGAEIICLITGHYAQGHSIELFNAARDAMRAQEGLLVLAAAPLEVLEQDELLDHAARWETSQMLATRPDLVRLDQLPEDLRPHRDAVLGEDPREVSSSDEGEEFIEEALGIWTDWVERLLRDRDPQPLNEFYERRLAAYADYIRTYRSESWEAALEQWWRAQGTASY